MAFADNNGVRIHFETEGQGPALVLYHGAGATLDIWRELGYVEALGLPALAARLRKRGGERYAGLRILARD